MDEAQNWHRLMRHSTVMSTAIILTVVATCLRDAEGGGLPGGEASNKPKLLRRRTSLQLVYRGYCYTSSKMLTTSIAWECIEHSCRVRLTTSKDGQYVYNFKDHNHPPNLEDCEAAVASDSRVQGCYLHYCQAIYRKLLKLGLSAAFCRNEQFRDLARLIMALAFLPSSEVLSSYKCIDAHYRGAD
jgi:hypothetical protein